MHVCIFPEEIEDIMASKCQSATTMGFGISLMQLAVKAVQLAVCGFNHSSAMLNQEKTDLPDTFLRIYGSFTAEWVLKKQCKS